MDAAAGHNKEPEATEEEREAIDAIEEGVEAIDAKAPKKIRKKKRKKAESDSQAVCEEGRETIDTESRKGVQLQVESHLPLGLSPCLDLPYLIGPIPQQHFAGQAFASIAGSEEVVNCVHPSELSFVRGERSEMYRAIVQRGFNSTDPESALDLVSKPIPTAEPGNAVVHITLRPINPTDLVSIRSGRVAQHYDYPVTVGSEGFGIVETIGEGVTLVKPGQRVVPLVGIHELRVGNGSWQEFVSLPEGMVVPVPDSIPDEVAAQFVINPWTAIGMLEDLNVPKGEYFLQTAAGSVIGRQIIQLAKHLGIKSINIVRRQEQKEELFALGADQVLCSTTEDIVSRVKQITSKKLAYGALDAVGGELTQAVTASVRRKGQVFVYGVLDGNKATVGIGDLFREVSITGWILTNRWDDKKRRERIIQQTLKYLEEKVLEPLAGEKYDLANFKEAIKRSEEVGRGGKVLLTSGPR